MHKLRKTRTLETQETRLEGEVEVDGAVFGGPARHARDDRVNRRLLANRRCKRRVLVVLRQRGGRTLPRTFPRESQAVARIDNCQPGGGAQLLTLGGVTFSADLQMHGGQIIAKKDVSFTAGATGVGLSIIAGGTIDGTSGMTMFACGERGMEGNFHIDHYRLAE
ncbi:MAG: hypothetical protein ACU0B9_19920 [Limimaricola soesokkakensis]